MNELDRLNHQLGFQAWAESEGFDLTTINGVYTDPRTFDAERGYLAAHGEIRPRPKGQQLFAEIKKSSKYASQAELCRTNGYGYPFKVRIVHDGGGNYCVKGGVGGQYRLTDVNLYVIEDGRKIRVR